MKYWDVNLKVLFYKNYTSLVKISKHVTQCHNAVLDVLTGTSVGWASWGRIVYLKT